MRRARAIAVIGLAVGITGCAGTQQCLISGPVAGPGGHHGAAGPCCCYTKLQASRTTVGPTVPPPPPAVIATNLSKPPAAAPARAPAAAPVAVAEAEPDPTRPIPVPAPGPAPNRREAAPESPTQVARGRGGVEGRGPQARRPKAAAPSDPHDVRTSIGPEGRPDAGRGATPGQAAPGQAAPGSASVMPPTRDGPEAPGRRKFLVSKLFSTPFSGRALNFGRPGAEAPRGPRDGGVVPSSAEAPAAAPRPSRAVAPLPGGPEAPPSSPVLDVGGPSQEAPRGDAASATQGKTIGLEFPDDPVLAGRPRLASYPPRPHTYLDTPEAPKADGKIVRLDRSARVDQASSPPRRESPVSRFLRRVRGAGRAFLDPDSLGDEPHDVAERGERVERVSAERLDKPSQR